MAVSVVVGGQYGSEGKGKVTSHLVRNRGYDVAVRCGGPNSGHTVTIDGEQVILQQVPAGVVDDECLLYLAAGCLIDKDVLMDEIERFDLTPERLVIDEHAVVISDEYIEREKQRRLNNRIGSTCTGTGEAVAARAKRTEDIVLAKNDSDLCPFSDVVADRVHNNRKDNRNIVVEGTQGFGLSVYHSPFYPKATSRDTTVAGFLSEVGIGHDVDEVIMVIRTFPIRVPGNSGPFNGEEISWDEVRSISGYPHEIREFTSVTNRRRRVAKFNIEIVKQASRYNQPTQIAFMGMDYLNHDNYQCSDPSELDSKALSLISRVESVLNEQVSLIGVGPEDSDIIDIRSSERKPSAHMSSTGGSGWS